jgi:Tol biopolymer transport system component
MTLDARGHRAGMDFRRAIDHLEEASDQGAFERFERFRSRKQRNQRIGAGVVGLVLAVLAIVFVGKVFAPGPTPAVPPGPTGVILFGEWDPATQQAQWFTVSPDGSDLQDLRVTATCAGWFPDGSRILISDDLAVAPGAPLRPAIVDPAGSNRRSLGGTENPALNLGCGDVSPDGTRIALEGFGLGEHSELDGIYSIRASDGEGLVQLLSGPVSPPRYSPDGTRLSYFDTKPGVSPTGSGALFVMPAEGGDPVQITPWGFAFDDHAWSPDGSWIVFQRPYGQLYLVRPDGSDLHRLPLELPSGGGALNPSWSPDGRWIAFSLQRTDGSEIDVVRPDGTGLRRVPGTAGGQAQHPDWAGSTT